MELFTSHSYPIQQEVPKIALYLVKKKKNFWASQFGGRPKVAVTR
jgi:hypothetical protein